jgi:hypothetical protein
MDTKRNIEAATGQRVYEYEDANGVLYYSFFKQTDTLSPPIRLRLKSRIGTHLTNFLVKLRRLGQIQAVPDEDAG